MPVSVVPWDPAWSHQFEQVAADLRQALVAVPAARVEHVGSTSVPGLAAKPILDIDVIVTAPAVPAAIAALTSLGYHHRGDLGVPQREAFEAPADGVRRHVYVCVEGTLHVRNHLAVRDVLCRRPDLRDEYAAVKLALAADPDMAIDTYIARKSPVLQLILAAADLTDTERAEILRINDPDGDPRP